MLAGWPHSGRPAAGSGLHRISLMAVCLGTGREGGPPAHESTSRQHHAGKRWQHKQRGLAGPPGQRLAATRCAHRQSGAAPPHAGPSSAMRCAGRRAWGHGCHCRRHQSLPGEGGAPGRGETLGRAGRGQQGRAEGAATSCTCVPGVHAGAPELGALPARHTRNAHLQNLQRTDAPAQRGEPGPRHCQVVASAHTRAPAHHHTCPEFLAR